MKDTSNSGFLEPVLGEQPSGAYPLTLLTYAALKPLGLDEKARSEYASFLDYAADAGQVSGTKYGQLPQGYVPLGDALRAQTRAAAQQVRTLTTTTTTTTTIAPTAPATSTPGVSSSGPRPPVTPQPARPAVTTSSVPAATGETTTTVPTSTTTTVPTSTTTTVPTSTTTAVRPTTPATGGPASKYAVVAFGASALAAALVSLELTKRARKVPSAGGSTSAGLDVVAGGVASGS
jgi:hypothetical protein